MIGLSLLAATFTFTATATGLEKGAPVEFFLAGSGSDRDYETLFLLDEPIDSFCRRLEAAGCPRGKPEDVDAGILWPVGAAVKLEPSLGEFLETREPEGQPFGHLVYTGGRRHADGSCLATTNQPMSVIGLYSLAQSPIVFDRHLEQGNVYNSNLALKKMEKGDKVTFSLTWDASTMPRPLSVVFKPGTASAALKDLKAAAEKGELDVLVDFDPSLTLREAKSVAEALSVIDSSRVRINGIAPGHLFYQAFLPMVRWLDRQERLVQPFELTLGATNRLVKIDEDWSVDGPDPKLTPREISFAEALKETKTTTCFVFATEETPLKDIYAAMAQLSGSRVRTWYVFVTNNPSLHNPCYTQKENP